MPRDDSSACRQKEKNKRRGKPKGKVDGFEARVTLEKLSRERGNLIWKGLCYKQGIYEYFCMKLEFKSLGKNIRYNPNGYKINYH